MDDDDRVLTRLDDFVEVADGAVARRGRERPVHARRSPRRE